MYNEWENNVYRLLVGNPEEKRPLGRPRRKLADNVKMELTKAVCGCVDWTDLAQNRDQWMLL
jgi:hypothetical protein